MSKLSYVLASLVFLVLPACRQKQQHETKSVNSIDFPKEMVDFVPYKHNSAEQIMNPGTSISGKEVLLW